MTRLTTFLLLLGLAACATPTTTKSKVPFPEKKNSLVDTSDGWWKVIFEDRCTIEGEGTTATRIECPERLVLTEDGGNTTMKMSSEFANTIGSEVALLKAHQVKSCGMMARFSSESHQAILIDPDKAESLYLKIKGATIDAVYNKREAHYKGASCKTPGEVVLQKWGCGSPPGKNQRLTVCGPPGQNCGAPLTESTFCSHNSACISGICGRISGRCEVSKNEWKLSLSTGCTILGVGEKATELNCLYLGMVTRSHGKLNAKDSEQIGRQISELRAPTKEVLSCADVAIFESATQRYELDINRVKSIDQYVRHVLAGHKK